MIDSTKLLNRAITRKKSPAAVCGGVVPPGIDVPGESAAGVSTAADINFEPDLAVTAHGAAQSLSAKKTCAASKLSPAPVVRPGKRPGPN